MEFNELQVGDRFTLPNAQVKRTYVKIESAGLEEHRAREVRTRAIFFFLSWTKVLKSDYK